MHYQFIQPAIFLDRPNRFIAVCRYDGQIVNVHVKNTGRCKELLIPGTTVYLEKSSNPNRKTQWSLIAVEKGDRLINMDSQAPNAIAAEGLLDGKISLFPDSQETILSLKREVLFGKSRFDLLLHTQKQEMFLEVKGVTLEENGAVFFPDAPTQRGVKHLHELVEAVKQGFSAGILFIVQMKDVSYFSPNRKTHPEFADALLYAAKHGVTVQAYDCEVSPDCIAVSCQIPCRLEG